MIKAVFFELDPKHCVSISIPFKKYLERIAKRYGVEVNWER